MRKQSENKTLNSWKLAFGLALAAVLPPHDLVAAGTIIVNFTSQTAMMNTGVEPGEGFGIADASGQVKVKLISQGNANTEMLEISLANLSHSTTYQLSAYLGDDTNAMSITNFTTNLKGSFKISYVKKSQGNQNPSVNLLPDALDPLCNVRELDVVNGSTNIVLRAILTDPDQGQYMVKRSMANTGILPAAVGNILIQADAQSTRFHLQALHLTPNTNYHLTINDTIAPPSMSDSTGLAPCSHGTPSVHRATGLCS